MSHREAVEPHTQHARTALEHVESVKATHHLIQDLYAEPFTEDRQRKIGEAGSLCRLGTQLAKVHAHLAIAEQLCRLGDLLEQRDAGDDLDAGTRGLLRREYLGAGR